MDCDVFSNEIRASPQVRGTVRLAVRPRTEGVREAPRGGRVDQDERQ